jgi:hypothetical protein
MSLGEAENFGEIFQCTHIRVSQSHARGAVGPKRR